MAYSKGKKRSPAGRPLSSEKGAVEAIALVRELQKRLVLRDKATGELVGVSQSSVHRALSRRPPRLTPTLVKLCNYAKNRLQKDGLAAADGAKEQLARAVERVWDGSPEGLNKLLVLLRDLGTLVSRG
jgi:hypothetical protein